MSNTDIIKQLDECKDVIKKDLGDNIYSYNFARHVFYKDLWTDLTCKARGLFINKDDNSIVARSYDKFFYINPEKEFQYPINVYVKENGFLGILSWNKKHNEPFIATKSTNKGKHVDILKKRLQENIKNKEYKTESLLNWNDLCTFLASNNVSMIFEVIDIIDDPHIITYRSNGLVLLDIVYNDFDFNKFSYDETTSIARSFNIPRKFLCKIINNKFELDNWLEQVTSPEYRNELEGFVLEDASGFMCKVKTPFYNLWKKVRTLHDLIANDKPLKHGDIRSFEELDIFKFMLTIPKDILKDMSIPTLRDRYFFEKYKEENNEV